MWISRLQVTSGFLAGLDVQFSQGLNVVIGPRGAGKTTLLNLLRHALSAYSNDPTQRKAQQQEAAAALGGGEVTIHIEDEADGHIRVVSSGSPITDRYHHEALFLAQNELESIADDPENRRNLLDLRAASASKPHSAHLQSIEDSTLRQLTARNEIADLADRASKKQTLTQQLGILNSEEARLMGDGSDEVAIKREFLTQIEDRINQGRGKLSKLEKVREILSASGRMADDLNLAVATLNTEDFPAALVKEKIASSSKAATAAKSALVEANEIIDTEAEIQTRAVNSALEEAAPIRNELNELEAGLGQVTAEIRRVRSELENITTVENRVQELQKAIGTEQQSRTATMAQVEQLAEERFAARRQVAEEISRSSGGTVQVSVDHMADVTPLIDLVTSAVKGTGLRGSTISAIAQTVLPSQLLALVESADGESLATLAAISQESAFKVVTQLATEAWLPKLASLQLEDRVDFKLMDHAELKDSASLSTGQKCSVVLPVVLSDDSKVLVLDQPEDHLDNSYLVDNVVQSFVARTAKNGQSIVATHNPNIPVLGDAGRVIYLDSNGKNASVHRAGHVDDAEIVETITTLMEGGARAFQDRADFYRINLEAVSDDT